MSSLSGKVAVVLGCSAEQGTGWAIAEGLARAGAKVVVAARTQERLERLAGRIGGLAVRCDAGVPDQIAALANAAADAYGAIDIAVNAAGLPVMSSIAEAKSEQLQKSLEVNYLANVHFVRSMAEKMNDGGSITLITSASGQQVAPSFFAYACAKAATDCLVRYAAVEYGVRGIRVNSILPGPIKTELSKPLFEIPGAEAAFAREIPLGRVGLPQDYADAVLWLSGPAFVTGLNLPVSGGNQLTRTPREDEFSA